MLVGFFTFFRQIVDDSGDAVDGAHTNADVRQQLRRPVVATRRVKNTYVVVLIGRKKVHTTITCLPDCWISMHLFRGNSYVHYTRMREHTY